MPPPVTMPQGSTLLPPRPVMPPPTAAYRPAPAPRGFAQSPQWTKPAYQGGHVPTKKSNAGLVIGLSLGAVAVLVLGVIGVAAASVSTSARTSQAGYTHNYSTTYPTSDSPYTTTYSSQYTTSAEPSYRTGQPTTTETYPSRTTATRPAGPQPVPRLADNPLFANGLGLPAVTCQLPRWNPDASAQLPFYQAEAQCLFQAWQPVLQSAGLPAKMPRVQIETTQFTDPCGTYQPTTNAHYCDGDHTIHMTPKWFSSENDPPNATGIYVGLFAHEFGHAIQGMTGVMAAYGEARYEAGKDGAAAGLEWSRRVELEASCFGGMFLTASVGRGAIDRNIFNEAYQDEAQRGDYPDRTGNPRDHGTPSHNGAWWQQGTTKNRTAQCNTWAASSSDVS